MGFDSGSMSFQRFAVVGSTPAMPDEQMLEKFAAHALKESEMGVPAEMEWGWCGGRHVLDGEFGFEHNIFNDCCFVGLRTDVNKVPGELKKAWQFQEEQGFAQQNPSGFASKRQKRDAKDIVRRRMDEELRAGRFRRSKLSAVLWDVPGATLYGPSAISVVERLAELFDRTFQLELQPLGSGALALRQLEAMGKRRDYEDLRPTRFVTGPGGESQAPEYPWTAKGDATKDFLGNEFLVWLWHASEQKSASVETKHGPATLMIDKSLDLDCVYAATGRDTLRGDGPGRMPEAIDALRSGKVPRKAGLIIDRRSVSYSFNLNAESLAVSTLRLPDIEADTPRTLFEERITMLRDFVQMLDELYGAFLSQRVSGAWENHVAQIRRWILTTARPATAVA